MNRPEATAWRAGNYVVLPIGTSLPPFCVLTGKPASRCLHQRVTYTTPASQVIAATLPIPANQTMVAIDIPLSTEAFRRHRWRTAGLWSTGIAAFGVATVSAASRLVWVAAVAAIVLLAVILKGVKQSELLVPVRVVNDLAVLRGACPAFLARLQEGPLPSYE